MTHIEEIRLIERSEIITTPMVDNERKDSPSYALEEESSQIKFLQSVLLYALPSILIQLISPIVPTIYSIPVYIIFYAVRVRK